MVQRFCKACKLWYDEECLDEMDDPNEAEGTTATEILQAVPYLRGCSTVEKPVRWSTVGTGIAHQLVEEYADRVNTGLPLEEQWEQWDELLKNDDDQDPLAYHLPGYVEYVQDAVFDWFECPNCKAVI
jgi:hypothetical protein